MCSFKFVLTTTNLTAIPAFDTPLLAFKFRPGLIPHRLNNFAWFHQWTDTGASMNRIRNRATALRA